MVEVLNVMGMAREFIFNGISERVDHIGSR